MCGIAGFFTTRGGISEDSAGALVTAMTDALAHRGPDAASRRILAGASSLVALGHRRLSVVDLSPAGAQPMVSADGRYTIVYNGEVYGLDALRRALVDAGCRFRGHSDTEIILEHIALYGVERTLPLLEGMFAFAVWDDGDKVLTLARDRAGIKPLYWMHGNGMLGFASELKGLRPLWAEGTPRTSADAKLLYALYGNVPAPHSIYENIHKLPPGHVLTIRADGQAPRIESYWRWRDDAAPLPAGDLIGYAHDVLSESVRITLDADVPVGCFLSGGIDSSLVTALMQAHCGRLVQTFAIGFEQAAFNEAPYAKAIAAHLGTDHTELIVSERDMLDVVPMMAGMYDEPFSDSSQIPTYLVSKLARGSVTVALTGDGGDELFMGYGRYRRAMTAASGAAFLPQFSRRMLGNALPALWPVIGRPSRVSSYLRLLGAADFSALYENFVTYDTPLSPRAARQARALAAATMESVPMGASFGDRARAMRRADFNGYMTDDVLTKVDRASMKVSLESRVPLLNSRVIDLARGLPVEAMMDPGGDKKILRDVLARYVPRPLFERPKMGFGVPLAAWIRGPLRMMVEDRISTALKDDDMFDAVQVRRAMARHLSGEQDFSYILWLVSCYGDWKAQQS